MKKLLWALSITLAAGAISLVGCGDSGGGAGGSNSGPSGGDDGGDDGATTSGQTCTSSHQCVNDVCNCGDDGKGMSCTDDTKCQSECRVCM